MQVVIPQKNIPEVLYHLHNESSGGHLGVNRTLAKIRERVYWVNYKEDVKNCCRRCEVCAAGNGPRGKKKVPMHQFNVGSPFERTAVDVAGPFPETEAGNKYILVAMDYSKWVEVYKIPNQESVTVARV